MSVEVIGEIKKITQINSQEESEYVWRIENFEDCYNRSGIDIFHESPAFSIGLNNEYQWTLDMFAAGYDYENADYVGIRSFLMDESRIEDAVEFTVEISLLTKGNVKQLTRKATWSLRNTESCEWVFKDFVLRRDLWNNSELLDELKFVCSIWINEPGVTDEIVELQRIQDTSKSSILEKLWDDRPFSDFKLIVGKKEFHVHQCVLAAASPVFQAMFESQMRESKEGKVDVEDVEPDVMETALHFIYTSRVDNRDHVDKLLIVAERYQLGLLKRLCENLIVAQMKIDNIYDTLLLADQNNADELKKQAIDFFLKNTKKLFTTPADVKASVSMFPISLQTEIICTFMAK